MTTFNATFPSLSFETDSEASDETFACSTSSYASGPCSFERFSSSSDGSSSEVDMPRVVPSEFAHRYGAPHCGSELDEQVSHWRNQELILRHDRHKQSREMVQPEVNNQMRAVVVEWLAQLVEDFALSSETLFLAVDVLNRYLSCTAVAASEVQLVGVVCLWIASKYEEVLRPAAHELASWTRAALATPADMRCMEVRVLQALSYQLSVPTPLRFLHYLCVAAGVHCPLVFGLAECLLQVSLLDADCSHYLPSHAAGAALLLALTSLHQGGLAPAVLALVDCPAASLLDLASHLQHVHRHLATLPQCSALRCRYAKAVDAVAAATAAATAKASVPIAAAPRPRRTREVEFETL